MQVNSIIFLKCIKRGGDQKTTNGKKIKPFFKKEKIMKKGTIFILSILLTLVFATGPVQAKEIKIGIILPLTGQVAMYGEDGKRGLDLALENINTSGGIKGQKVKLIYEDSTGTPKGAVSAAQKLININKVDTIIGCLFSTVALAVKPISRQKGLVFASPTAANPELFNDNIGEKKFFFSLGPLPDDEIYILSKYFTEKLNKKTVGVLYMLNDTGLADLALYKKWLPKFGGKVVISESFNPGATDFRTQLTKIKAANPDILYMNTSIKEGVKAVRQISELKLESQIAANSQLRIQDFLDLAGKDAEGMIMSSPHGESDKTKKLLDDFNKHFIKKYETKPNFAALQCHDIALAVFAAMEEGGPRGKELRDAMNVLNIPGINGMIQFRENGSAIRSANIWKVKEGKFFSMDYIGQAP